MAVTRRGLNCTLSYMRSGVRRAYRVRANMLSHGMQVIYDESASRTRRAFYPHRLSSAQFAVGIELKGEEEYRSFTTWLASYADYVLSPNLRFGEFPSMTVSMPSEGFLKKGVPLSGYEWGDQVAKIVWPVTVVFETVEEPGDRGRLIRTSRVSGTALQDREMRYFYPSGIQLSGQATPPDGTYTKPVDSENLGSIFSGLSGAFSDLVDEISGGL